MKDPEEKHNASVVKKSKAGISWIAIIVLVCSMGLLLALNSFPRRMSETSFNLLMFSRLLGTISVLFCIGFFATRFITIGMRKGLAWRTDFAVNLLLCLLGSGFLVGWSVLTNSLVSRVTRTHDCVQQRRLLEASATNDASLILLIRDIKCPAGGTFIIVKENESKSKLHCTVHQNSGTGQ